MNDARILCHAHDDPYMAATPERSPGGIEAPRSRLTAVRDSPVPAPLVAHDSADRSNRFFNRLVGVGLAVLVVLLAALMLNAGINVEVLP
jgi:hypothetical protein